MLALAAGAAWTLAALTCPGFGQAIAQDAPVVAHEHNSGGDAGHVDNDLCCKAIGDSTTIFQMVTTQQPGLTHAPAPAIAIAEALEPGQVIVSPRDRPPIQETTWGRAKRFVSFSSHAPPAIHV